MKVRCWQWADHFHAKKSRQAGKNSRKRRVIGNLGGRNKRYTKASHEEKGKARGSKKLRRFVSGPIQV